MDALSADPGDAEADRRRWARLAERIRRRVEKPPSCGARASYVQ